VQRVRNLLAVGSLALGLTALAACGATADPTATLAPVSTLAPTAAARPSTAPSAAASSAPSVAPSSAAPSAAVATRTTSATVATPSGATATRAATSSVATATRAGSPVASATRPAGTVLPPQAVANLQQIGNSRQAWVFSGFTVAGYSGDLRPVFEYNGGNQKVALTTAGANIEAYQVGGTLYVNAPLVGVVQADAGNPLATPAQTLFATPGALFSALVPSNVTYTPAGTESINGRMAMRYTASVNLPDLGFVNPTLAGQSGTAATTIWVDTEQGYLVALNSDISTSGTANTTASARLDVTNVGQVPAITVPR